MSFRDFSGYIFGFDALDLKLPDKKIQIKYYNRWMKKYAEMFSVEDNFIGIEWGLRCHKALREIFSSATFFIEAKKNLEMKCFSSYYFCLYYSLFHAIYSGLFFDTQSSMRKLLNITHKSIVNTFIGTFGNSKEDIMTREIEGLFKELKYKREYYSYVTPFNNIFNHTEGLELLGKCLIECYQLSSLHSLMIENSYNKNIRKVTIFKSEDEVCRFYELFEMLFAKKDDVGKNILDSSSKILKGELLQYGFKPTYIALDLEHQFDEFHTYDGFYNETNERELKICDIWSFILKAINP